MKVLKLNKEIELLIGAVGGAHSLYMAIYLFFGHKRNTPNFLLTFFFFCITLRVIKSLLWIYFDNIPDWFLNLGFIAHLATGPTLYLYLIHYLHKKKWSRKQLLHYAPIFILTLLVFNVNEANFWYKGGYSFLLYHQLIYTFLSLVMLFKAFGRRGSLPHKLDNNKWIWLFILIAGISMVQFAYFSNYILEITPYSAGPVLYGLFIYIISIYTILRKDVLEVRVSTKAKYQNIKLSDEQLEYYKRQLLHVMTSNKPYLNSSFSLEQLSKLISLPPYLSSHIINKGFNKNFPEFVNSYRIDEAKSKLISDCYSHLKIAEIAYECGFNTLSSFNCSFKKITGLTPSQFKKHS